MGPDSFFSVYFVIYYFPITGAAVRTVVDAAVILVTIPELRLVPSVPAFPGVRIGLTGVTSDATWGDRP